MADVLAIAAAGRDCLALHQVNWHSSLLSLDGHRLLCHFAAADAESVRVALRQLGANLSGLWPGTIHHPPDMSEADQATANVLVERSFDEPVDIATIQAQEDANTWCLEAHHATFLRTFFSADRKRMLCLYRAPDAESLRLAQHQAHLPFERVWSFTVVRGEA
jgi:hypothetical protein